jgi:cell division protein FtsB
MGLEKNNIKEQVSKVTSYKYIIAVVLFLGSIIFFDENSIITHQQNKQRLQELLQQKEYYKERIKADKQKLKDLNSGMEELEKFAREQYYMSKPGEDVFIVVKEKKK